MDRDASDPPWLPDKVDAWHAGHAEGELWEFLGWTLAEYEGWIEDHTLPPHCPTECDLDCKAWCHESHLARPQRRHEPDECPSRRRSSPFGRVPREATSM